jgi:hypothetical protein
MSKPYQRSTGTINRELSKVAKDNHAIKRLKIDIAALLTGSTSGKRGNELAHALVESNNPREVARELIIIGERFLHGEWHSSFPQDE